MTDTLESLREENAWLRSELMLLRDSQFVSEIARELNLPVGAARVVEALYRAKGRTVDAHRLLDMIGSEGGYRLIRVRVCQARRVLGRDAIENTWGLGYRLSSVGTGLVEKVKKSLTENLSDTPKLAKAS